MPLRNGATRRHEYAGRTGRNRHASIATNRSSRLADQVERDVKGKAQQDKAHAQKDAAKKEAQAKSVVTVDGRGPNSPKPGWALSCC
jgi:hypothetical protein